MNTSEKILHLLRVKASPMTIAEIAEFVGISPKTARRHAVDLAVRNLVYNTKSYKETAAYTARIPDSHAKFLPKSISLLKQSLEILQQCESTDAAVREKRDALIAELKEWLFVKSTTPD